MQDEAEECEYPSIGSDRSLTPVHFTCRGVAFVSGRGIFIVPVLPGMCILSPWKYEVVHRIDFSRI